MDRTQTPSGILVPNREIDNFINVSVPVGSLSACMVGVQARGQHAIDRNKLRERLRFVTREIEAKTEIMKQDALYGVRSDRHQAIMMMDADELHAAHTFTAELTFNEAMLKSQFDEAKVPDASCIFGVSIKDGKPHRFCVGNEDAEILPKFLMGKSAPDRTHASKPECVHSCKMT
jgi:hypothetical protein